MLTIFLTTNGTESVLLILSRWILMAMTINCNWLKLFAVCIIFKRGRISSSKIWIHLYDEVGKQYKDSLLKRMKNLLLRSI